MKRAIAATAITLSVIGGSAIVGRLDRTVPATTTAPITTHEQPATGVRAIPPPPIKEAEKEAEKEWPSWIPTPPLTNPPPMHHPDVSVPSTVTRLTQTVSAVASRPATPSQTVSVTTAAIDATTDPYHDSMLPGGSKWASDASANVTAIDVTDLQAANATSALVTRPVMATETSAVTAVKRNAVSAKTLDDGAPRDDAPRPPLTPDWTRCSTSWAQTLTLGKSGEQLWTFSTTLSDTDVQDFATSVRWYADIVAKYPTVARVYAWLDCAGWRVRDYHQHASNVPPADYFGAQGLDSPLGTCHSTTPFRRTGAGRCSQQSDELGCSAPGAMSTLAVIGGTVGDDGKVRGWVRWHGDWYVGTVVDATCTDACVVGFDHPCDLSDEREQPVRRWDVAGKMFYSWWWGGDVNGEPPW